MVLRFVDRHGNTISRDEANKAKAKYPETKEDPPLDFMKAVEVYMVLHKCSKGEAIQAIAMTKPELHRAYLKQANPDKKF